MAGTYKKIVLVNGLENIDDYQFRTVKSLLADELKLTRKMQDDYDRIKIADMMEAKFPKDSGIKKLIEVFKDIPGLEDVTKALKQEKLKVKKVNKKKGKTAKKRSKQDKQSTSQPTSTTNEVLEPGSTKTTPSLKRKKTIKTKDSKKMKLTQEQNQLLEPSATTTQHPQTLQSSKTPPGSPSVKAKKKKSTIKSEDAIENKSFQKVGSLATAPVDTTDLDKSQLQTPPGLTPFPPIHSASKKSKGTKPQKCGTVSTQMLQKEHQLPELPATSPLPAVNKPQIPHGLLQSSCSLQDPKGAPATTPSSHQTSLPASNVILQTNQEHSKELFNLYQIPQGSPATAPIILLTSVVPCPPSSGIAAAQWPSAATSSSAQTLQVPPTQSHSLQTHQVPPSKAFKGAHTPPVLSTTTHNPQSPQVPTLSQVSPAQASRGAGAPGGHQPSFRHLQTSQVSAAQASRGPGAPRRPQPSSRHLQTSQVPPAQASRGAGAPRGHQPSSRHLQTSHVPPAQASRGISAPGGHQPSFRHLQTSQVSAAQASRGAGAPRGPQPSSCHLQTTQVPLATASNNLFTLWSATNMPSNVHIPQTSRAKNDLAPGVAPATMSSSSQASQWPPASETNSLQTQRPRKIPTEPSVEDGCQEGPKEVMVLKATEPFIYDMEKGKRMFHATVATESEFFRVKVFDTVLRDKFTPNKVIAISQYVGRNGFLEIYSFSNVSYVNLDRGMRISPTLRRNANATPKINYLCSQKREMFVNGVFLVIKKNVRNTFTYYEIKDNTGTMEVVVHGRLSNIECEPGDKLSLICFELSSSMEKWQLRSRRHSYMQVIRRKT